MRAILVILLVVLVLLLGLPMAMGMAGSGFCPDCQAQGPPCPAGVCPVILMASALVALHLAGSLRLAPSRMHRLLVATSLDRPPRSA